MALKTVVAISKKTYGTSGTVVKVTGVDIPGGGTLRTAEEWLENIIDSTDSGTLGTGGGLSISTYTEFNYITPGRTLEFIDTTIAKMLGFATGIVYPALVLITAVKWGASKLVLQNAENEDPLPNSMVQIFEETGGDFENENVILRGFPPFSSYDKENDREVYNVQVKMFPVLRRNDVKDFLQENAHGMSETVNVLGLGFKVAEDLNFNISLDPYTGIKDQHANKNLKEFNIGLIVEV